MKKLILCIITALFFSLGMSAQNVETKAAYKYEFIVNIDKTGKPIERKLDGSGIVLFAQAAGQEAISVTIGETEMYTGIVYSKKQELPDKNTKMIVYLAIQEFQGHKVPLQIFEIYDLRKSSYIPDSFTVMICSEKTGEMIQGQSFHNVSRIR